MSMWW